MLLCVRAVHTQLSLYNHHCPIRGRCQQLCCVQKPSRGNQKPLDGLSSPEENRQCWKSQCLPSDHSSTKAQGLALAQNHSVCPGIDAHRHSHLIYNNSVKNTGPRAVPEDRPGEQTSTRGMRKGASSSSTQSLLKADSEANRKETQRKLTEIQAETAP